MPLLKPISFTVSRQLRAPGAPHLRASCVPRLRSVVGAHGELIDTVVCASGATLGAFDHQRTINLLEEAVLSNMVLRRQLAEVQAAHAMVKRENDLREEFASMAAHELRAPLQTLSLQTQLRRRMPPGVTASTDRDEAMMQRDERMISNMVRLIDDMRDSARMQHGQMAIAPHPMDLRAMVQRVVQGFEAQAAAAGCVLICFAMDRMAGTWDEFRLEQVLGNMLTNAIRYGPGRPIRIGLEREAKEAVLSVSDNGRGIAQADYERIFERFERAGDHGAAPGLGLGLYISRQIAQQHGGRMEVSSALGRGSDFRLRLPLLA
jgi:signal transduction histidine kinase